MKNFKMMLVLAMVIGMVATGCGNRYPSPTQTGHLVDVALEKISVVDPPAVVASKTFAIKEKILFDFDSDKLDAEAQATIKKVADLMAKYPDTDVALAGHTDKYGSDDYNANLSLRRAEAVADALVALGVEEDKIIKIQGFGKQDIVSQVNRENRRVLILTVD